MKLVAHQIHAMRCQDMTKLVEIDEGQYRDAVDMAWRAEKKILEAALELVLEWNRSKREREV